jgi:hypothetical protein
MANVRQKVSHSGSSAHEAGIRRNISTLGAWNPFDRSISGQRFARIEDPKGHSANCIIRGRCRRVEVGHRDFYIACADCVTTGVFGKGAQGGEVGEREHCGQSERVHSVQERMKKKEELDRRRNPWLFLRPARDSDLSNLLLANVVACLARLTSMSSLALKLCRENCSRRCLGTLPDVSKALVASVNASKEHKLSHP